MGLQSHTPLATGKVRHLARLRKSVQASQFLESRDRRWYPGRLLYLAMPWRLMKAAWAFPRHAGAATVILLFAPALALAWLGGLIVADTVHLLLDWAYSEFH